MTQDAGHTTQNTACFHSDHLGSSNVITDQDGRQVASYEYTPYGGFAKNSVIARSEAKQDEALTSHYFTGKELESTTGLYYYGARYYDPQLGRFITPDSIVQSPYDPQSLNRYSYCRNNPINYVDPTGHWWFIVTAIIAVVKAAAAVAAAHPFITGAILNVALNARNINSFGSFAAYAGIGAISGGAAAGAGGAIGGVLGSFWGSLAAGAAGGLIGGFGNASYGGASFGQALAFGFVSAGVGAATGVALYGAGKAIGAIEKVAATRGKAAGVKTPVGEQGKGSATSSLNANKGESASNSQALSSRGSNTRVGFEVRDSNGNILYQDAEIKVAAGGEEVYRQWGGEAGPNGKSWSPENPVTPGYENRMGIPTQPGANTGEFISKGTFKPGAGYYQQPASGIGTNTGGGTEYGVPNPQEDIRLDWVHMPDDK